MFVLFLSLLTLGSSFVSVKVHVRNSNVNICNIHGLGSGLLEKRRLKNSLLFSTDSDDNNFKSSLDSLYDEVLGDKRRWNDTNSDTNSLWSSNSFKDDVNKDIKGPFPIEEDLSSDDSSDPNSDPDYLDVKEDRLATPEEPCILVAVDSTSSQVS